MQILVDADANPKMIQETLYRAADRLKLKLYLVTNLPLKKPNSPNIFLISVNKDPDAADNKIVELTRHGDLIITSDIPLADRVIEKGGIVITPRGELLTKDNIKQKLSLRDLLYELRNSEVQTGGPPSFKPRDGNAFANRLDSFLNSWKVSE